LILLDAMPDACRQMIIDIGLFFFIIFDDY